MVSVKDLVRSIITSYFGPNKNSKFIIDGKEVYNTKCALELFQKINLRDPMGGVIEATLFAHHERFGCSTLSLLVMWYLWNEEFEAAIAEGCTMKDIVTHSQNVLDYVISNISQISKSFDEMLCISKNIFPEKLPFSQRSASTTSEKKLYVSGKKPSIMQNASDVLPRGLRFSSRHFSPFQHSQSEDEGISNVSDISISCGTTHKYFLRTMTLSDEYVEKSYDIVKKLSHDDSELAILIHECWKQQVLCTGCLKFKVHGIITCLFTLPCSFSTVVDGLIVKSDLNYMPGQDLKIIQSSKTLIIKGSITSEYVHIGFAPKVTVVTKKPAFDFTSYKLSKKKDEWLQKCCNVISELQVKILLVKGDVDDEIAKFCYSHSIYLLPNVPWTILKILCQVTGASPCTYLTECNEKSIISSISIRRWNLNPSTSLTDKYYQIDVHSNNMVKLQTVVICHPSIPFLQNKEHQFWHLTSRLTSAVEDRVLPGGGQTEHWCYNFLKPLRIGTGKARVVTAIADGFHNFSKLVSNKKMLVTNEVTDSDTLDDMQSKVHAWQSAMGLMLMILQCDAALINGCDNTAELGLNFDLHIVGSL